MQRQVSIRIVWLGFALAVTLALTPGAIAQPGEFVKGVLQPLADGFPKRAITFVVADDPGSRDGIYARTLQQALKGISPVPILVSDEPAWGLRDLLQVEGSGKRGKVASRAITPYP